LNYWYLSDDQESKSLSNEILREYIVDEKLLLKDEARMRQRLEDEARMRQFIQRAARMRQRLEDEARMRQHLEDEAKERQRLEPPNFDFDRFFDWSNSKSE